MSTDRSHTSLGRDRAECRGVTDWPKPLCAQQQRNPEGEPRQSLENEPIRDLLSHPHSHRPLPSLRTPQRSVGCQFAPDILQDDSPDLLLCSSALAGGSNDLACASLFTRPTRPPSQFHGDGQEDAPDA